MAYGVSQNNGMKLLVEEKDEFATPYAFAVLKGETPTCLKNSMLV